MSYTNLNDQLELFGVGAAQLYEGEVVSIEDPLNLGRVQVSVPGLYDPDLGDLPWVGISRQSPFGVGSNFGTYGQTVGANAILELQGGDPQYPIIVGFRQKVANPNFADPTSWGFKDPNGNILYVQGKLFQFTSVSNVVIKIEDTKLSISVPSDITITTEAALSITSTSDVTVTTQASATVTAAANAKVKASLITLDGDTTCTKNLLVQGNFGVDGEATNGGVNIGKTHRHPVPNVRGGPDTVESNPPNL